MTKRAKTRQRAAGGGAAAAAQRDTDLEIFQAASEMVVEIDRRYRLAKINDKVKLKPERDRAFTAYTLARLRLLEDGMLTGAKDLAEMQALKEEMDEAAATQDLIIAAARVAAFLAKLALK